MNNNFNQFESKEKLHETLCAEVARLLDEGIKSDGNAVLAVSGGSTPKPLFEKLSGIPIEWEKVTITLVDERWVNNTHKDSNEKLIREYLLQNYAAKVKFIPLKSDDATPFKGVTNCNIELSKLKNSFDVIILGMGTDAHTASFFPKDENLSNALTTNLSCAATVPSDAPHKRITLSLNKILKAKNIFLHIEGEFKKFIFNKALEDGKSEDMPIRALLNNKKTLEVYYAQ
jgi:6-phosphogluconolactonase